jgi:RNA polymerase sigma factor (sigma-70 family)
MSPPDERREPVPDDARRFATTRWSVVLAAGGHGLPDSKQALATLCETYWYPLYAYLRRRGCRADEAQDLTQEFFAQLLEKDSLRVADPQRGRFRSFLLASLNHFLANQWRSAGAGKRGGRRVPIPLDFRSGESRYGLEPSHELTPEKIYQRRWALSKLRDEFAGRGKLRLFEHLKAYLVMERSSVPYREVAAQLDMTEGAVKVAVHRLRRRCRELLREEIAHTVAEPAEIDEELRELFAAISP